MIPYAACMCFGGERDRRRRPWKLLTAQEGTSVLLGQDFYGNSQSDEEGSITSALSTSEIFMLEAIGNSDRLPDSYAEQEVRTVSKRSRQPVITRMLDHALLDDTYAGITKVLLSKCNNWAFNTFNLDVSTGGRSLSYLLVHLFQEYGFVKHFELDIVKVWHCFNLMEAAYHRHNPYHNSVHAADVTQAMHCFLQENKFSAYLTPLEAMSSVIAAVSHDLDHPGVTQAFLVATSNHLVNLYHNSSVLENHHWRTAISCLSESGIFDHLEKDVWHDIRSQIRSLILATDITRQKEFLAKFKNYLSSESLDMEQASYRHFALQIALKCADLCNPCRPWAISQRWSYQVCQEFYRQGAYERQLKLPLTPAFDCSRTKVAKIQADFFQFVVSPLFITWDHFLKTPLSSKLLENLQHNFIQWQERITTQQEDETVDVERDVPQINVHSSLSSDIQSITEKDLDTEQLLSANSDIILKQHRSKSDSGLTPGLLSPKVHMETYSTEELHPSTTLLSLSSITNTVQLRQVYAATKVESHLICPTVFQPSCISIMANETINKTNSDPTTSDCDTKLCSNDTDEIFSDTNAKVQCSVNASCPNNGCCTPPKSETSLNVYSYRTKQRSQSLIGESEDLMQCSQVSQKRRASDFDSYIYNNLSKSPVSTTSNLNKEMMLQLEASHKGRLTSFSYTTDDTSSNSPSISYQTKRTNSFNAALCSNRECSESSCMCETEPDKSIPSWCWHISRSFSAERPVRPTHDFDSPLPSAHGSVSSLNYTGRNRRRGSAPVTYSFNAEGDFSHLSSLMDLDCKGDLKENYGSSGASGRRWSIPTEISDFQVAHASESKSFTMLSSRRNSFDLLEPLPTLCVLQKENVLKRNCSNLRSLNQNSQKFPYLVQKDKFQRFRDVSFVSSETFVPFVSSTTTVQRRSSLPTDLLFGGKNKVPRKSFEPTWKTSFLLPHSSKNSSPSDLLSVLIGRSGMLNTMHENVRCPKSLQMPYVLAQESSRRRSGGLEMFSDLWKSHFRDVGMSVGMASKINLQHQLLESWSAWRLEERKDKLLGTTSIISSLNRKIAYQRRSSVPLTMPLLSLSSECTRSGEEVE